MGADGGIDWIRVTDKQKFHELVKPLELIIDKDYYQSYHYEYLDKEPLPKDYVWSCYGTNHDFGGCQDLVEVINYWLWVQDEKDWYWQDQDPLDLTWEEILVEYFTNSNYQPEPPRSAYSYPFARTAWFMPYPVRVMYDRYKMYLRSDGMAIKDDLSWLGERGYRVLRMKIRDWLAEILPIIDLRSVNWAETWT